MNNFLISDEGLDLIKSFEGCKLHAYLDSVNVPTIGYGHTRGVSIRDTCTQEQAEKWLRDDAGWASSSVNQMVIADITQNMFDALVSFAFNLGTTSLRNSTLMRKLNKSDFTGAAGEFERWVHAGGKVLQGLVRRRLAERALFEKEDNV